MEIEEMTLGDLLAWANSLGVCTFATGSGALEGHIVCEKGGARIDVGFGRYSPTIGDERANMRFVSVRAWQKDGGMSAPCGTLEKAERNVRLYAERYGLSEEHMQLSLF